MSGSKTSTGIFDRWTILILLASAVWQFWAAGRYTVFDDESFSCRRYVMPMGEMLSALRNGAEPDPPLYYVLQNVSVRIFGVGPVGLRSLSIVLFLLGLIATRAAAQAWFDRRVGVAAMIIAACHPAHVMLGFAARWYSAMFLGVAVLLWSTAVLRTTNTWRFKIIWTCAATSLCYINYFGPIVVAMTALAAVLQDRRWRLWLGMCGTAACLYLPWFGPYWRQVHDFRAGGGAAQGIVSSAARSMMALLAGNLASITSWWVWGPMTLCVMAVAMLLVRQIRFVWPLALVVVGCFGAGALSGVMIEKYIMIYSGVVCILIAALLMGASDSRGSRVSIQGLVTATLAVAWIGCGMNLVREKDWSSLRWLDPFKQATSDMISNSASPPLQQCVFEHTSAWYYYGLLRGGSQVKQWREVADLQRLSLGTMSERVKQIQSSEYPIIVTLEAADLAVSDDWKSLMQALSSGYFVHSEKKYLEDPDWSIKDRLDPRYRHPQWRIVVREWRKIDSASR